MSYPPTILDEELTALLRLIPYMKTKKQRNGLVQVTANDVPVEVMAPFIRALMRREARLLQEDADEVSEDALESRTPEQRRADAFVDLVTSILAPQNYYRPNHRLQDLR